MVRGRRPLARAPALRPEGRMSIKSWLLAVTVATTVIALDPRPAHAAGQLTDYGSHATVGRSLVVTTNSGQRLRLTPYGDHVVRVQAASRGEPFTADDRWEIVVDHAFPGAFTVVDQAGSLFVSTGKVSLRVDKSPVKVTFLDAKGAPRLAETTGGLA